MTIMMIATGLNGIVFVVVSVAAIAEAMIIVVALKVMKKVVPIVVGAVD